MKPKNRRTLRIITGLFTAILLIAMLAVNTVDDIYRFVSDDIAVHHALYKTGVDETIFINLSSEDGKDALNEPTRLVEPYRITDYISWYMESGSESLHDWLTEKLTENDMLYIDALANMRRPGLVARQIMYVFIIGYVGLIFAAIIYSGISELIKSKKNQPSDEEKPRGFDPSTLIFPLMIGIPYLLLIIITTYFPEVMTECLAKLLHMDTLPALTQGDVLYAIFTPDILHSFIREMFLSFKDDIVWLFIVALIPMVKEFIKKKFPFLSLEETSESEVDDH